MSLHYQTTGVDADTGAITGGTGLNERQLKALYQRDSTADYQLKQLRLIATSYANPSTYFEQKAIAMTRASDEASKIFSDEYKRHISNLVPHAQASIRARKLADAFFTAQEESLEDQYPSDMSKLVLGLAAGRGEMNRNGFAQPDASFVKPVVAKRGRSKK